MLQKIVLGLFLAFSLATQIACKRTKYDKEGKPIDLGRYRIRTFPKGAKIWINGTLKVAHTPATLVLKEGEYKLKIQVPGAESVQKTIYVEAGEGKSIDYRLPAPPPASISVYSDIEGAEVRINGYKRGETPLREAVTKPGPVDVTVSYGPMAKSRRTRLKIGQKRVLEVFFYKAMSILEEEKPDQAQLKMSLPKPEGYLTLGLKPDGYLLDHQGKLIGETPVKKMRMLAGKHRVILRSKDGHYERRVELNIEAKKTAIYRFRLNFEDEVADWQPGDNQTVK